MIRPSLASQSLFGKSLVAAFFFHVFFLSVVVVTFPRRFEGHKPHLISLGSILEPRDVESALNEYPPAPPADGRDFPEKGVVKFVYEFFEMAQNPSKATDVPKPAFEGERMSAGEKMTIKPTFDQGQAQPRGEDEPVIDDHIPSYRPLRFSPYD